MAIQDPGTNEILIHGENSTEVISQTDYQNSSTRDVGFGQGIADPKYFNKLLRQLSRFCKSFAKVVSDNSAYGIKDNGDIDSNAESMVNGLKEGLGINSLSTEMTAMANDIATAETNSKDYTDSEITKVNNIVAEKETPAGAQAKADTAEQNSKAYADLEKVAKTEFNQYKNEVTTLTDNLANDIANIDLVDTDIDITDANNHFTATKLDGVLDELFTFANDGKTLIANALNNIGITSALPSDTFPSLATKIGQSTPIKSIQRGYVSTMYNTGPQFVNISSVNINKSIVRISVVDNVLFNYMTNVKAYLDSSSRIKLDPYQFDSRARDICWEVTEFDNAKSIQKGSFTNTSSGLTTQNISIAPVNPSKSQLFFNYKFAKNTSYASTSPISGTISNNSTLTFYLNLMNFQIDVQWYVVEFN